MVWSSILVQKNMNKIIFVWFLFYQMKNRTSHAFCGLTLFGPCRDKTCLRGFAKNKGVDQPAHPHRLISACVVCILERIISKVASSKISIVMLVCVARETGLSLALSETPKTVFVTTRPIYCLYDHFLSFISYSSGYHIIHKGSDSHCRCYDLLLLSTFFKSYHDSRFSYLITVFLGNLTRGYFHHWQGETYLHGSYIIMQKNTQLFVAFPWVETSTGLGGLMICVFIIWRELPKAQPKAVLWRSRESNLQPLVYKA